jgi:hypothetical protein
MGEDNNSWEQLETSREEFDWIVYLCGAESGGTAKIESPDKIVDVLHTLARLKNKISASDYAKSLQMDELFEVYQFPKTFSHKAGLVELADSGGQLIRLHPKNMHVYRGQCLEDSVIVLTGEPRNKLSFEEIFCKKPSLTPHKRRAGNEEYQEWHLDLTNAFDPILIYPFSSRYSESRQLPLEIERDVYKEALNLCYGVAEDPKIPN